MIPELKNPVIPGSGDVIESLMTPDGITYFVEDVYKLLLAHDLLMSNSLRNTTWKQEFTQMIGVPEKDGEYRSDVVESLLSESQNSLMSLKNVILCYKIAIETAGYDDLTIEKKIKGVDWKTLRDVNIAISMAIGKKSKLGEWKRSHQTIEKLKHGKISCLNGHTHK